MEQKNQEDLYRRMNAVFQEKEELYRKREQELGEYREELQRMESTIARQKEELGQEREMLRQEKEELEKEKGKLAEERRELDHYREIISGEMEQVLQEKLMLQSLENERLRQEGEKESRMLQQSRAALGNQEQGKAQEEGSLGKLENQTPQQPEDVPDKIDEASTVREEGAGCQDGSCQKDMDKPQEAAGLIGQFAKKAAEIFPDGTVLEATEEAFCMGVGDKELRILMQSPPAAAILAKREKSKHLMKGISQFNRMQSEWKFSYQNNCLQCMMPFTEMTPADVVLQKCADAMTRYFL